MCLNKVKSSVSNIRVCRTKNRRLKCQLNKGSVFGTLHGRKFGSGLKLNYVSSPYEMSIFQFRCRLMYVWNAIFVHLHVSSEENARNENWFHRYQNHFRYLWITLEWHVSPPTSKELKHKISCIFYSSSKPWQQDLLKIFNVFNKEICVEFFVTLWNFLFILLLFKDRIYK